MMAQLHLCWMLCMKIVWNVCMEPFQMMTWGSWSPRMPFEFLNFATASWAQPSLEVISITGILKQTSCNHLRNVHPKFTSNNSCDLTTMDLQENVKPVLTTLDKQLTWSHPPLRRPPTFRKITPTSNSASKNSRINQGGRRRGSRSVLLVARFSLMLTSLGCNGWWILMDMGSFGAQMM